MCVQVARLGEFADPMRRILLLGKGIFADRHVCGSLLGLPSVALSLVGLARVPRDCLGSPIAALLAFCQARTDAVNAFSIAILLACMTSITLFRCLVHAADDVP